MPTLETIIAWLIAYKYFIVVPIAFMEGPIISIIVGFLASLGHFNLYLAYPIIVISDLSSDIMWYAMGRFGRKKFLDHYGHYIGLHTGRIMQIEHHFIKHPKKTLIFSKLSQGIGAAILIAAGIAKMPFLSYLWCITLATVPKSFILIICGFYFGAAYATWDKYLNGSAIIITGLAVFLLVLYLSFRWFARKEIEP